MSLLSDRLALPDVANLTDWQAAEVLNQPDQTLPPIITYKNTQIGPGIIMAALGADAGAALLELLTTIGTSNTTIKWAMQIINRGELDLSQPAARNQIDSLVTANIMTSEQGTTLKALAEVTRYPSWAEYNNVIVTPRTVGIARGNT